MNTALVVYNGDVYLFMADVAERLGVTTQTLANWRARREGPPFITHHGMVLYPIIDLTRWIGLRVERLSADLSMVK